MIINSAINYIKNNALIILLKGIKYFMEAVYFIIPSFSPYEKEISNAYISFKFTQGQYQYIFLIVSYSLVISALFYFLSLWTLKKKKYIYI